LRIKEQETRLILYEHDDDDDDVFESKNGKKKDFYTERQQADVPRNEPAVSSFMHAIAICLFLLQIF
jgi:virulence-associated protein VagC